MTPQAHAATAMEHDGIFGAFFRKQSYLNIAYLLLSFPLGTFYFAILVTGLSAGIGLSFIGIGILILLLMFAIARRFTGWERRLAISLLGARISTVETAGPDLRHPFSALKSYVSDPSTWKGLFFLFVKFPLGIASFTVSVTLISFTLGLLLTPLTYVLIPMHVADRRIAHDAEVLVCLILGAVLAVLTIHVLNGLAALWRGLARMTLVAPRSDRRTQLQSKPVFIP
jgi:hypothetical protein